MALAQRLESGHGVRAEIVSMDSMMVFRGMDIGTAKPTADDQQRVPHHCLDLVDTTSSFSVRQWLDAATAVIENVRAAGAVPIVVGGTHLYAMALLRGLFEGPPADVALRAELAALPTEALRRRLLELDPEAGERIHPNDTRRTIRAIEVCTATGSPISSLQTQWDDEPTGVPGVTPFLLSWETGPLNQRINSRVRVMIEHGLIEEAKALHEAGSLGQQASEALGYKQLVQYFDGLLSLDDAVERIKIETRRYAKNQRTWTKRLKGRHGAIDLPGATPDVALSRIEEWWHRAEPA